MSITVISITVIRIMFNYRRNQYKFRSKICEGLVISLISAIAASSNIRSVTLRLIHCLYSGDSVLEDKDFSFGCLD